MSRKLRKHVVHLINDLNFGGLERKLEQLLREYPTEDARHTVVALSDKIGFKDSFNGAAGVSMITPNLPDKPSVMATVLSRVKPVMETVRKLGKVDIIHSWSLTSHLYLAPLRLVKPDIKGRVIAMDLNFMLRPVREDNIQFRLGNTIIRKVAESPRSRVVSISPEMTEGLLARAFTPATIREISNGVSTQFFKPVPDATASVKDELGLNHVQYLVGIASRHGPSANETYKDVPSFVHAMSELKHQNPELFQKCGFIICGFGTDRGDLQQLAQEKGVDQNLRVLGPRNDMARQYSAWDISNICSVTEPFGLVVPEAMACETPCVVTDTSLFPEMVGDTGIVVQVNRPDMRAEAWQQILRMPEDQYQAMGQAARARVEERYSHTAMVNRYVDLYQELTDSGLKYRMV